MLYPSKVEISSNGALAFLIIRSEIEDIPINATNPIIITKTLPVIQAIFSASGPVSTGSGLIKLIDTVLVDTSNSLLTTNETSKSTDS